ncbi:MAG: hypothetical protein ABEH80_08860 [Halobaculum sp.]
MTDNSVDVQVTIEDGRTVVGIEGEREAAVVIKSASGERIYLPPEDFDQPPGRREGAYGSADTPVSDADSPYDSPRSADSPYESAVVDDSSYQRAGGVPDREGVHSTPDGFQVVHPEPATEFRVLR